MKSERAELEALTHKGKTGRKTFITARALVRCDAGPHGWTGAKAPGVSYRTIGHLKKGVSRTGLALKHKKSDIPPLLSVLRVSLKPVVLACSADPQGSARWMVRLLADKAVELPFASSVFHMTVQWIVKNVNKSHIEINTGTSRSNKTRPLQRQWKMLSLFTICLMTMNSLLSAWTSPTNKWLEKRASQFQKNRGNPNGWTRNMPERALPTSFYNG